MSSLENMTITIIYLLRHYGIAAKYKHAKHMKSCTMKTTNMSSIIVTVLRRMIDRYKI